MEMTLLTREQLKLAYDRDLSVSFPRDELKPFRAMAQMLGQGSYRAWGLMDGEDIAGLATVWNYAPGWALFDYLCVSPHRRSDGLGSQLVQGLVQAERGNVLFGESEIPEFAPDPDLARRRIGFYQRNGAKEAGYDMTLFGVPYRVLRHAARTMPDTRCGFIHIPFLPEQVREKPDMPCLSLEDMVRALTAALEVVEAHLASEKR